MAYVKGSAAMSGLLVKKQQIFRLSKIMYKWYNYLHCRRAPRVWHNEIINKHSRASGNEEQEWIYKSWLM